VSRPASEPDAPWPVMLWPCTHTHTLSTSAAKARIRFNFTSAIQEPSRGRSWGTPGPSSPAALGQPGVGSGGSPGSRAPEGAPPLSQLRLERLYACCMRLERRISTPGATLPPARAVAVSATRAADTESSPRPSSSGPQIESVESKVCPVDSCIDAAAS